MFFGQGMCGDSKFGIISCQVSEEQLSSEFRAGSSDQTNSSIPQDPKNMANDENATLNAGNCLKIPGLLSRRGERLSEIIVEEKKSSDFC